MSEEIAQTQPETPVTGEQTPQPVVAAAEAVTPTVGADSGQPTEAQSQSITELLANHYGIDIQAKDEAEAFHQLALQARQAQALAQDPNFRAYRQHQTEFQKWHEQQAKADAAQKEAQAQQGWFKKPEYDPRWVGELERDPLTKRVKLRSDSTADPSIVDKFNAWENHRKSFLDNLLEDPDKALSGFAEQIQQRALEKFSATLQRREEEEIAQQILHQNASRMFDKDTRTLTEWGKVYKRAVQVADEWGLTDPVKADAFAKAFAESHTLQAKQAPVDANKAVQQKLLNRARKTPNVGGALEPDAPSSGLSIGEKIQRAVKKSGMTTMVGSTTEE